MTTATAQTTQVYQIFFMPSRPGIGAAITTPVFTARYFHQAPHPVPAARYLSLAPDGDTWGDGPVFEFDPPRKLVHEWRSLYDADLAAEEPSRVTWEIEPQDDGTCLLTVVHDRLEGAPKTAASVSGPGWMHVLSGLKTLLQTGQPHA